MRHAVCYRGGGSRNHRYVAETVAPARPLHGGRADRGSKEPRGGSPGMVGIAHDLAPAAVGVSGYSKAHRRRRATRFAGGARADAAINYRPRQCSRESLRRPGREKRRRLRTRK